jgi:teichuronic acid biosynthesis glycosyltransferase TuaH
MSFVFAGPVQESYVPEEFYTLQNVHFIGRIPYEDMPAVIKGFDVAIIPFKKDEVSNTIFPLKLFEYLGAGKPVVATDFNLDLKEFTMDEVQYCSSADDFSAAIGWSMDNDTEESRQRRIAIAAENSWDKRLSQFKLLIEQSFNENE